MLLAADASPGPARGVPLAASGPDPAGRVLLAASGPDPAGGLSLAASVDAGLNAPARSLLAPARLGVPASVFVIGEGVKTT